MLNAVGAMISNGESVRLVCLHWRVFPPIAALRPKDIQEQRRDGDVSEPEYQQYLVWKRICGLLHMNKRKCRNCPQVRYLKQKGHLWVLETPDGKMSVPIVDLPTLENLSSRAGGIRPQENRAGRAPVRRTFIPGRKT